MANVQNPAAARPESDIKRQPVLERPMITVLVMNHWEPYRSDRASIESALEDVKTMGFDSVTLSATSAEDLFQYAEIGAASSFVGMQLHMMESARKKGLGYIYLGAWAGGDNLGSWGQRIREFDPRMPKGCRRIAPDGKETHWYNYSSPLTLDVTSQHLVNLLTSFREDNYRVLPLRIAVGGASAGNPEAAATRTEVLPLNSHWDPSIFDFESLCMGSFDDGTIRDFRGWLRSRYGNVAALNDRYNSDYSDFESIEPPTNRFDYAADASGKVNLPGWVDWLSFLGEGLAAYLGRLTEAVKREVPQALIVPCIQQWGLVFNLERRSGIGWRGVNPFEVAPHVDGITAIPFPLDADCQPDPYVVSFESSLLASAAKLSGRVFVGSPFVGVRERNVSRRVMFEMIAPEEYIGVLAANGAQSLWCYGYNGADDGGNLVDQPADIKRRLMNSFDWYRQVYPYIREGRVSARVGLIFPYSAFLEEPGMEPNLRLREELLGWFKLLSHCHIHADLLDLALTPPEALDSYWVLILPWWETSGQPRGRTVDSRLRDFIGRGRTVYLPEEGEALGRAAGLTGGRILNAPGLTFGLGADSSRDETFPGCLYQRALAGSTGEAATLRDRVARALRESGVHPPLDMEGDGSQYVEVSRFEEGVLLVNHSRSPWQGRVRLAESQIVQGLFSAGPAGWTGDHISVGPQNAVFLLC